MPASGSRALRRPLGRLAILRLLGMFVLLVLAATLTVLTGCTDTDLQEAELLQQRETQLSGFAAQAESWGEDIVGQISNAEIDRDTGNLGGVRPVGGDFDGWPRLCFWDRSVELRLDGPRTPTEVADALEPWLRDQGWMRRLDLEFPPTSTRFERDYVRDGFHLAVEVYTEPPPMAQTIAFTIVSPSTS